MPMIIVKFCLNPGIFAVQGYAMSTDDKNGKKCVGEGDEDFPICDFPDLRRLRAIYLKCGGKPVGMDSTDTPRPDEQEEDFGLRRSTAEEALELLREAVGEETDEHDPLTEFLDDDE